MLPVQADNVFVNIDVLKDEYSSSRLSRLLEKIDTPFINYLDPDQMLSSILSYYSERKNERTGHNVGNPIFLFDRFNFENPCTDLYTCLTSQGFSFADYRSAEQLLTKHGVHCNSAYEIHSVFGCLHRCSYCHIGAPVTMMLNIEEMIENLESIFKKNPNQHLFKYDNQSDILLFEPEYDAVRPLIDFFASKEGAYLMLYSKSDNVDSILDLSHNGKTIACWTLSPESIVGRFELGTPSTERRILAAEKCEQAGYPIRFRFSPIIPIIGWQDSYVNMIEEVFARTSPDLITLQALCHMDFDQAKSSLGLKHFNPEFTKEMVTTKKKHQYELFSVEARVRLFSFILDRINEAAKKHGKKVKTSLCLETAEVWNLLRNKLSTSCPNQMCTCAPFAIPHP